MHQKNTSYKNRCSVGSSKMSVQICGGSKNRKYADLPNHRNKDNQFSYMFDSCCEIVVNRIMCSHDGPPFKLGLLVTLIDIPTLYRRRFQLSIVSCDYYYTYQNDKMCHLKNKFSKFNVFWRDVLHILE